MKDEKTENTEDVKTQVPVLSDLPVNDEHANETVGGSINFTKIKFDYKPQDDKDTRL